MTHPPWLPIRIVDAGHWVGLSVERRRGRNRSVADLSRFEQQIERGELIRVLDDWCQPFAGFFLYYPSRRQQPAALTALVNASRL